VVVCSDIHRYVFPYIPEAVLAFKNVESEEKVDVLETPTLE
jgi:hypothetical protein